MLERGAVHLSTEVEADLIAAQSCVLQCGAAAADAHRSRDHLKLLIERELVRLRLAADGELPLPCTARIGRHGPEINRTGAAGAAVLILHIQHHGLIGFPIIHVKIVRHDTGPGFEREQFGPQQQIHARQQIHCDHGGLAQIGVEQITLMELHAVADAGGRCVFDALLDAHRIQVDAEATRAELFRCGHYDAAVARAQVNQVILRSDFCHLEHAFDHFLRCRHIGHARFGRVRARQQNCQREYSRCTRVPC